MAYMNIMINSYCIDKLSKDDYYYGYLELLEQMTVVGTSDITYDKFCEQFDAINSEIYIIRNINKNKIIASGSILIEKKFIHKLSSVGHIEDIVIDTDFRRMGLGKYLLGHLSNIAKERGCYKVILDCSDKNIKFYEKCGFVIKEFEMAKYF